MLPRNDPHSRALALINQAREAQGLNPLVIDRALWVIAQDHLKDMALHKQCSTQIANIHPEQRLSAAQIRFDYWVVLVSESTLSSPESCISDFLKRNHTYKELLSPQVSHIGIACLQRQHNTLWVIYLV